VLLAGFVGHLLWLAADSHVGSDSASGLFSAFVCISKCVKCVVNGGGSREEGGRGQGEVLCSIQANLLAALGSAHFLCIKM